MNVTISHIVVIGCSLSYGQGLENPRQDSWPALLAKKLNVPVVNLSSRGGGNDRIMRRLYEYHYLNSSTSNPFYVLAFSHSSRREEYLREEGDYSVVSMKDDPAYMKHEDFSFASIYNYDPFVSACKKLMIRSYVLDFLNLHNINYLITDFMPDSDDMLSDVAKRYPLPYQKVYSDKFKLKNLSEISSKHPRLPCGHDDVIAQSEMASYIYDELLLRYGQPSTINQEFTTLQEYAERYSPGSKRDIDWL